MKNLKLSQIKQICEIIDCKPTELRDLLESDWLLLTDEEADEMAYDHIEDTLWAFNASFLSRMTDIDEEVFTAIQANDRCESNNDAIKKLVESTCGLMELCIQAIDADGRGHFMSSYDGIEHEIDGDLYLYRIN